MKDTNMTWEFVIRELCLNLDSESAIREVLVVAVDENMLTREQAASIAREVQLDCIA